MASEETNFYKPDDSASADSTAPKDSKQTVAWTASEFIEHQRGAGWYSLLFIITVVLAVGIYFLIHDYFAVGIIVVLGIITGIYAGHQPSQVGYEISSTGIKIGEKSYAYNTFKSFSVIHEGALISLNFYPLKRFSLTVSAFLDPKDQARVTEVVGEHLPLEQRSPDGFENLTRRLKL